MTNAKIKRQIASKFNIIFIKGYDGKTEMQTVTRSQYNRMTKKA